MVMLFEKIVLWNSLFHISIYDAVSQLNDRAKEKASLSHDKLEQLRAI